MSRTSSRAALAALLGLCVSLTPIVGPTPLAAADGTPDISLVKSAPAEVLYGDTSLVEATASNGTAAWGYNLSFRDVLPEGVSYVPSTATPSDAGEPTILVDQPSTGETTLLWVNIADLAPGNAVALTYEVSHETSADPSVDCDSSVLCVGESYTNTAQAFVNSNPRFVPDFDPTDGTPITGASSFTGNAEATATSTLVPFILEKTEPNREGEILRGIHDFATPYTLTVTNNAVNATNGFVLDDYLPAGLEFLACGGVDNTTDAPTNADPPATAPDPEYPGASTLDAHLPPADCLVPGLVETVEIDPDGPSGPLLFDVYTHVRWTGLGDLSANGQLVLTYLAGIPIRENVVFPDGTATTGVQTANLDNNSGDETFDEQELTNHAEAAGTYQGVVFDDGPAASTDTFDLTRTAEDLSVHKSVSSPDITQGGVVDWTLLIETSEYRFVDDIVVTDTLPDGLCPLAEGTDFDTTEPVGRDECNATTIAGTQNPSTPFSSDTPPVENPDGTWTLTFDRSATAPLAQIDSSSAFTITFPTQARSFYQENGADATPTLGRDGWANQVSITGNDFIICDDGDTLCAAPNPKIDADETDGGPDLDVSGADQEAPFDEIQKYVAAPVGSGPVPAACAGVTAWLTEADAAPLFAPGDRVCWRLQVEFNSGIDTRNATVTDFIPPNTAYEPGSAGVLPTNTADIVAGDPVVDGDTLTWRLGTDLAGGACDPDAEDCYVEPNEVFDVVFSVIASDDPAAGNAFDLISNLMKFSASNTVGQVFPLRDDVTYELAEPVLSIDKANDAPGPLVQGDDVVYSLTVANDGNEPALDVEVWDFLPPEVGCADVTAGVPPATCTPDAGGPDRLEWVIAGPIAPGDDATVTYTVRLPDGTGATAAVAAADLLLNTAGIRTYETETNLGGRVDYFPAENIDPDPTITPNADVANDTSVVTIVAPTITKTLQTLTVQDGNDGNTGGDLTRGQATVGETVRYTLVVEIPADTSIYAGQITDALSSRHTYVADSAVVTFPDTSVWNETAGVGALPAGYDFTPGPNLALDLPASYQNTTATTETFVVRFDVTVDDEIANSRTSSTIRNRTTLASSDSIGDPLADVTSADTRITVVEPLVSVVKSNGAAGPVQGGSVVPYTVRVTNSSATRVSTANDLVIVDTLPEGLTSTAPVSISNGGTFDAGPPQTITWNLPTLLPGQAIDLTYTLTVDNSVSAGSTYRNDVVVDSTSMPSVDPQGPERTYADNSSSDVDVIEPPVAKSITPSGRTIGEAGQASVSFTIPANVDLFDASLVDDLGDGLVFESFDGCSGDLDLCAAIIELGPEADTPTPGKTRIAWFLDDIASSGAARDVTVIYTVVVGDTYEDGSPVSAGDDLVNSVSLSWNESDVITSTPGTPPEPADFAQATAPTAATVDVLEPSLSIDKDVNGQVADDDVRTTDVDETLTYTVVVTNSSTPDTSAAHDLVVADVVPTGLVLDTDSITAGGSYDGVNTITWSVAGPVLPGETRTFTYQAEVDDSAAMGAGTAFANTATITEYFGVGLAERTPPSSRTFRAYGGESDTVTVTPAFPDLDVTKTSIGPATIGEPFTWVIAVDNVSTVADAFGIDVADTLPADWSFVNGSATIDLGAGPVPLADPAIAAQDLTWTDIAALAPGDRLVVSFAATPQFAARTNTDHVNSVAVTGDDADGNPANADGAYTDSDTDEPTLVGARLGDVVWEDLDGDGLKGSGEPGIEGVAVTLYLSDGTTELLATSTGPGGAYLFDLLPAGSYVVGFGTPPDMVPTAPDAGDDALDSDATDGLSPVVALGPAEENLSIDAGFYELVDLGDFVWEDLDGDGVQDPGEPGIDDVTVDLFAVGIPVAIATQQTGPDGDYLFSDLPPGDYEVRFVAPAGLEFSNPGAGATDEDSDADPTTGRAPVTLVSGVENRTIDAGLFVGAAIGDVVWFDLDGDGVQGVDEPGVEGVAVELFGPSGSLGTQLTGPNGGYLFTELAPAAYHVVFTLPVGFDFAPTGAGTPATDSDADPATGQTPQTTLSSGETDRTWDAGLVGTAELGDFVWDDQNGDGVQDGGEPGIPGATVSLTWAGPDGALGTTDDLVLGSQPTGPDGDYLFTALPPGLYDVSVTTLPTGFVETSDLDGVITPSSTEVSLAPGESRLDVDFGYQQQADLALVKTVDDDELLSGELAIFRLFVSNNGPAQALGPITVVDTVPVGLTPLGTLAGGWTCDTVGQVVTCTHPGPLASGDSLSQIALVAEVDGDSPADLTNTATVSSPTADVNPANDTDTADVTTSPAADLVIDKSHAVAAFVVGSPGDYTIQVANQGPSTSTGTVDEPITVTDTLPVGLVPQTATGTGWTCSVVGQDVTCTIEGAFGVGASLPAVTVTVAVTTAAEGGVVNTATVAPGDTVDPDGTNDSDDDPTDVVPAADLSILKTPAGPFTPGTSDAYDVVVSNAGPSADAGPITVVDSYPVELTFSANLTTADWSCSDDPTAREVTCTYLPAGPHPIGDLATLTLEFAIDPASPAGTDIDNVVVVSSPTIDPDPDNNDSTGSSTSAPEADLTLSKSHTGDFQVGTPGTWLVAVGNNGPSTVQGTTTVTDPLPTGITFSSFIGAGWNCADASGTITCTSSDVVGPGSSFPVIELTVDVGPGAYPAVVNAAEVAVDPLITDPDPTNNGDDDPTTVMPLADLAIDKSHAGDFTVGVDGAFDLTVTNLGTTFDPGPLTVVDELPPGLDFVSGDGDGWSCVAAGQTVTCERAAGLAVDEVTSFELVVTVSTVAEGVATNRATVSSPAVDPDATNDTDTDDVTVIPSADIAISKTHDDDFVVGREATWSIDVSNAGPSVSTGPIVVTDTVPDGFEILDASGGDWACDVVEQLVTCTRDADLVVGNAPTISLIVVPLPGFEGATSNTATVEPTVGDPDLSNNASTDPVDVIASVDLGLVKSLAESSLVVGSTGTYRLLVTNNGPSEAVDVTVTDRLPAALSFNSSSGAGWTCVGTGGQVDCALDRGLASGESTELTLVVDVVGGAGSSVENIASVASTGFESAEADNTGSSGSAPVSAAIVPLSPNTGPLPRTGTDALRVVLFGLVLIVVGRFAVQAARRRRRGVALG